MEEPGGHVAADQRPDASDSLGPRGADVGKLRAFIILDQLAGLLREKRRLDFHYALQGILKAWLFVHIPFTYSLLIFSIVHLILVFGFSAAAP